MDLPVAIVTVRFDKGSVTGAQIAALVQKTAGTMGLDQFILEHGFCDGDVISFGQDGVAYNQIRVVPSLEGLPFFRPEASYSEVKVTSHAWGDSNSGYAVAYSPESVINAVKAFAAALVVAYEAALFKGCFPEYVELERSFA